MNPPLASDILIAVMIIMGDGVEPYRMYNNQEVREAIVYKCIEEELLDPLEKSYFLSSKEDFETDVPRLQQRYQQLKDIPKIKALLWRFPPPRALSDGIRFNRAFRKNMENEMLWNQDRAEMYRAVIKETDFLYQVWDAARDLQCSFYHIDVRRQAAAKLQVLLRQWDDDKKDETFNVLQPFPPCAPFWRFRER
jgi:hypothetical protein